jgi:hypothetical protein
VLSSRLENTIVLASVHNFCSLPSYSSILHEVCSFSLLCLVDGFVTAERTLFLRSRYNAQAH